MIQTEKRSRYVRLPRSTRRTGHEEMPEHVGYFGGVWWVVFLLFAGYLLFAHGCHGGEDAELSAGRMGRDPAVSAKTR